MRNDGASSKRVGVRNCYRMYLSWVISGGLKDLDVLFKNWVLSESEGQF